jgi:uncharacterized protein
LIPTTIQSGPQSGSKPNEYLAEIWGEMADDEAFADEQELQEFLRLLMRHWNSIGRKLEEDDVFYSFVIRG